MKIQDSIKFGICGKLLMLAVVACLTMIQPVHADTAEQAALNKAKQDYVAAWSEAPLGVSNIEFVTEPAENYGQYTPRENSVFAPGDELVVYLEPTGYGFGREGNLHTIALDTYVELQTPDGKVLVSTSTPEQIGMEVQTKIMEFQATLVYRFHELPAGDYLLNLKLEDRNSQKSGEFPIPFTIGQ